MDADSKPGVRFALNSKRIARELLVFGENRFELLVVELEEARERLVDVILLSLGVAVFGLLAGIAGTGAIVVLFWEVSPLVTLLTLTVLHALAAVFLYWRLSTLLRDWHVLNSSLDQLRKDRTCLEESLT